MIVRRFTDRPMQTKSRAMTGRNRVTLNERFPSRKASVGTAGCIANRISCVMRSVRLSFIPSISCENKTNKQRGGSLRETRFASFGTYDYSATKCLDGTTYVQLITLSAEHEESRQGCVDAANPLRDALAQSHAPFKAEDEHESLSMCQHAVLLDVESPHE